MLQAEPMGQELVPLVLNLPSRTDPPVEEPAQSKLWTKGILYAIHFSSSLNAKILDLTKF